MSLKESERERMRSKIESETIEHWTISILTQQFDLFDIFVTTFPFFILSLTLNFVTSVNKSYKSVFNYSLIVITTGFWANSYRSNHFPFSISQHLLVLFSSLSLNELFPLWWSERKEFNETKEKKEHFLKQHKYRPGIQKREWEKNDKTKIISGKRITVWIVQDVFFLVSQPRETRKSFHNILTIK